MVAVGPDVTRFRVGDRVAGIFFEQWLEGPPSAAALASDRGGNPGGMLSEFIVSHEDGLVAIPEHLSYEEAATLPTIMKGELADEAPAGIRFETSRDAAARAMSQKLEQEEARAEERRVGEECWQRCRSRWSPKH